MSRAGVCLVVISVATGLCWSAEARASTQSWSVHAVAPDSARPAESHDRRAVSTAAGPVDREPTARARNQHRAYVAQLTGSGRSYSISHATLIKEIGLTLNRWRIESNQAITSFTITADKTFTTDDDCSSTSTMWDDAEKLWPGTDFGSDSGDHLIVVVPTTCGGSVGTVDNGGLRSGGKVLLDPATVYPSLMHELGHNFGLSHAHSLDCDPASGGGCKQNEYGNDYDFMGYTEGGYVPASLDSAQRTQLGIVSSCEVPTVALTAPQRSERASYDLFGRGTTTGTRGLRITDPATGARYYLDLRNHVGRDAGAFYGSQGALSPPRTFGLGVTVERVVDATDTVVLSFPAAGHDTRDYSLVPGQHTTRGGMGISVRAATGRGPTQSLQVDVRLTRPNTTGPGAPLPDLHGSAHVPAVGHVAKALVATTSGWRASACFRYQWLREGHPIGGARSRTYLPTAADAGHRVSVRVTGQAVGYAPLTVRSGAARIQARSPRARRLGASS